MTESLPGWIFRNSVETNDGIRVTVEIEIPARLGWSSGGNILTSGEIAHNAAVQAVRAIEADRNEVPF